MKNLTLSLEDRIYDQSQVIAAQRKTTVSGLVREFLSNLSTEEARREQARKDVRQMVGEYRGEVGSMPTPARSAMSGADVLLDSNVRCTRFRMLSPNGRSESGPST